MGPQYCHCVCILLYFWCKWYNEKVVVQSFNNYWKYRSVLQKTRSGLLIRLIQLKFLFSVPSSFKIDCSWLDNNNNNNGYLSRPLSGEPGALTIQIKHTNAHTHTHICLCIYTNTRKSKGRWITSSLRPVNHEGHTRATNEKVKDRIYYLDWQKR